MLFMTYKPKTARSVKAERVTEQNIQEIAAAFFGTAQVAKNPDTNYTFLAIGTLNGALTVEIGEWIVRSDSGIIKMTDEEFTDMYEKARVTREG